MNTEKIKIDALINAEKDRVWEYYTQPKHITKWNFATDDWQCPSASNDMRIDGKYKARMEAKDGSFGFDFEATYREISPQDYFKYDIIDGREVKVTFLSKANQTEVQVEFDPESLNPVELQRGGWQAILNNFKKYAEENQK